VDFFQGPFDTADGAEDHGGDDDVDAVVRHVLHVLGESDDETFHFDVRMVGLFLEELLLEEAVDFDGRQFTFGRIEFEIVAGTGSDFQDPQGALLPQLRIGRFVTLHRREMLSLNLPTSHVIIGQRWIKFGKNPAT
jgi:hypothetical protein